MRQEAIQCSSNIQEAALIAGICGGRRDDFASLIQPHAAVLRSVINRMMSDRIEAEDVIQLTLIKAYLNLSSFRGTSTFRTWLLSIAANEVRQNRRQRSNAPVLMANFQTFVSMIPGADSSVRDLERQELIKHVREAVARLPQKYKVVVELQVLQGFSTVETARKLRLSISGVKSRYLRARKCMARLLADEE